jgi:hypothetical protein
MVRKIATKKTEVAETVESIPAAEHTGIKEVIETVDTNKLILAELKEMNKLLADNAKWSEAADWKLWIIMNGVCDSLMVQGLIDEDPRIKKD